MTSYKVTYFDAKFLGEGIRLILSYMGADWEDVRIKSRLDPKSPWHEMKAETKFGKLPYLEVNGEKLYQSAAICRYLASEAGLLGSNAWENAQIDVICGTMTDLTKAIQVAFLETHLDAKEEKRKILVEETMPYYLEVYDEIVKENGYLANGTLSWVDFYFVGAMETPCRLFDFPIFEKYPNLSALREKLYAIPNVEDWIDKRPDTI